MKAKKIKSPGRFNPSRRNAVWLCSLAYLIAGVVAIVTGYLLREHHPLVVVGAADVAATVVVFGFSVLFGNSSVYDPYWSVVPPLIAIYLVVPMGATGSLTVLQAAIVLLVFAWGARLTYNWLKRWRGMKDEDWRYVDFRNRYVAAYWPISFFGIHLIPTVFVFLGCLPLYPALVTGSIHRTIGVLDMVAIFVTGMAIWYEATADRQLRHFLTTRTDKTKLLKTGLWAYSRHPNYFGEVLFWWGIYLFGLAADATYYWTIIGPVSITVLFFSISVPMITKRMTQTKPGYEKEVKSRSGIVPWPSSRRS